MKKNDLMNLRKLKATVHMMALAAEDIPRKKKVQYGSGTYMRECTKFDLFMRSTVQNGILIVAMYTPQHMRLGNRMPVFQLYIDKNEESFLTYDYERKRWLTGKLDRIEWKKDHCEQCSRWISAKDAKTVLDYLGTDSGDYWGILKYQQGIRAKELKIRHRRETDPWDADLDQTPAKPKDWERWIGKVAIQEHFIFYRYTKKGATSGYCSYCEKDIPIHDPKHNKKGRCPCCRHKITFKSVGKMGTVHTQTHCAYLMQRCKDGMMIRFFTAHRSYRKEQYKEPVQISCEYRRTICTAKGVLLRAYYWGDYRHTEFRWIEGGIVSVYSSYYSFNNFAGRVYGKTLPDLMKRGLSYTGLKEYLENNHGVIDPERYLGVLKNLPQLEQIIKAGLPQLAEDCIKNPYGFRESLRKQGATSLTEILGINTQELKRLRKNNGGEDFIGWLQYEKTAGTNIPDKVITWFCHQNVKLKDIDFITDRMSMEQIYNYLRRCMSKERMTVRETITTWADYLSMAARYHMNTQDEVVFRTNKLKLRHDELVLRGINKNIALKAGEILQKFPRVEEICQGLAEKYEYEGKDYVIMAPHKIEEIIQEGNVLRHCISTSDRYWERIERHESYLLFLRRAEEPKLSYYTMEIEPGGTVRQIRTHNDHQNEDIEDARAFLREWQAVVAKRLTADDQKKAEKSRVLRMEEFVQMRTDQVKIMTGHLAGRLLADVLAADLMENAAA